MTLSLFFENNSIQILINFLKSKVSVNKLTKCMIPAHLSGKHVTTALTRILATIKFGLTAIRLSITKTNLCISNK